MPKSPIFWSSRRDLYRKFFVCVLCFHASILHSVLSKYVPAMCVERRLMRYETQSLVYKCISGAYLCKIDSERVSASQPTTLNARRCTTQN